MVRGMKLIIPLISAILGVLITNYFNIFEHMLFIPSDHVYEICITVYFAIIDNMLVVFFDFFSEWFSQKYLSQITAIIHNNDHEPDIKVIPTIQFDTDDLARANIVVKIKGKRKHFEGIKLTIKKPSFAEMQSTSKRPEVSIDEENYTIDLIKLFGNSDVTTIDQTFKISLIKNSVDGDTTLMLMPELSNKKWNVKYEYNNAQLKAGRNE